MKRKTKEVRTDDVVFNSDELVNMVRNSKTINTKAGLLFEKVCSGVEELRRQMKALKEAHIAAHKALVEKLNSLKRTGYVFQICEKCDEVILLTTEDIETPVIVAQDVYVKHKAPTGHHTIERIAVSAHFVETTCPNCKSKLSFGPYLDKTTKFKTRVDFDKCWKDKSVIFRRYKRNVGVIEHVIEVPLKYKHKSVTSNAIAYDTKDLEILDYPSFARHIDPRYLLEIYK